MRKHKRRIFPGALALLCLVTLCCASFLPSGLNPGTFAQSDPGPDLIVDSFTWLPETLTVGSTVIFYVTIKNQGDNPAAVSEASYYIDDEFLSYASINQLIAGSSVTKTFSWKATPGEHIVRVVVDRLDSVEESNEENNDKSYALSVLTPDLVVHSITWTPENPSLDEEVVFTITVKIQGSYRAGLSNVGFFIDGVTRGNRQVSLIEPGDNATTTFPWQAKTGSHTIKAVADGMTQVNESDETNNEMTVPYATAAPDLIVRDITWSPEEIVSYDIITFSISVSNNGTGTAFNSTLAFYIDDVLKTTISVGQMSANSTATLKYYWGADKRPKALKAVIDSFDVIVESNEANNELVKTIGEVYPDIIVQSITWSPNPPLISHNVTFTVTVKNQGNERSGSVNVDLYIDEKYKLTQRTGNIAAGSTRQLVYTWLTQSQSLTVRAVADENNDLAETNETNNTLTATVSLVEYTPNADLTVQNISYTPSSPSINDSVTISVTIKNNGTGGAGISHVKYLFDGEVLEEVYVDAIAAGAQLVNTCTWAAEAGTHTITVIVDSSDGIEEIDETNNEGSVSISAYAPDLYIQDMTWSPIIPSIGDSIKVNITIKNLGDRSTGGSYVSYYVDGDNRGSHYVEDMAPDATITKSFSWQAESESLVFKAVIDKDDTVLESNELNNTRILTIPAPDLIIENFEWSPDSPTENATVTLNVTVKNIGNGNSAGTRLAGYVDDSVLATIDMGDIASGESASGTFTWTAVPGDFILRVAADDGNGITEIDETNNEQMTTISVHVLASDVPEAPGEEEPEETDGEDAADNGTDEQPPPDEQVPDEQQGATSNETASKSWYEGILTNYWYVIGLAVLGGAAIVLLLILRKRSRGE